LGVGLVADSTLAGITRVGGGAAAFSLPDHIPTRRFSTFHSSTTNFDASTDASAALRKTEARLRKFL